MAADPVTLLDLLADGHPSAMALPEPLADGHPSRSEPITEAVRLGPEVLIWRRAFSARPDQAAEARRFVRFLLGSTVFADDAELIVGELAGNAIRHTRSGPPGGHFTVEITLTSARHEALTAPASAVSVLVTVYDLGGGGVPRFSDDRHGSYEENGRGLAIVTALAARVGYQGTPTGGHRVWAYLTAPALRPGR